MTFYAFNSQTKINPSKPLDGSSYFGDEGQVLYVCQPLGHGASKTPRVMSSHGEFADASIGTEHEWIAQSGMSNDRRLGTVRIVGIVRADGTSEGVVPTRSLTHHVAK